MRRLCGNCGRIHEGLCENLKHIGHTDKEYKKFLHSTAWKKKRKRIIERDNYCCQRCLAKKGKINYEELEVHHIIPRIKTLNERSLWLEDNNLITVCRTCNMVLGDDGVLDFEKIVKENGVEPNI